jgi:hypothetical protein
MSRSGLLNTYASIYTKVNISDSYGIPVTSLVLKGTYPVRYRDLTGNQSPINGKLTPTKSVRFYFNPDVIVSETDVIVWNSKKFEVTWVNPLSLQTGKTEGIQVDAIYIETTTPTMVTNVGITYSTTFTNTSLVAGILTVTHNLNKSPVLVQVYNNSGNQILPDQITIVTVNQITIDLNSFVPLIDIWSIMVG